MRCTGNNRIQCKTAIITEGIKDTITSANKSSEGITVFPLINEEPGFLAIDNIDFVFDIIFCNQRRDVLLPLTVQTPVYCGSPSSLRSEESFLVTIAVGDSFSLSRFRTKSILLSIPAEFT